MEGLEKINIQARTPHKELIEQTRNKALEKKRKKVSFEDFS